jgi:superfamily II RNA helicase
MSTYLNQIDPSAPCEDFPPADQLACPFPFPLDPFQKHAVKAIHQGDNVLVTAKTGSGKTLVGEYLVHHCLKQGKRVFYTTPIKSLSNQKFHDLKRMFPSVGLMTGDLKYKPDAQILIMTTEILRNLLYKQGSSTQSVGLTAQISLEGLGGVIFDECHYINDRERGKVWEETMILLDPKVQLVLLSATIDKPELFASWLGDLKQIPIHLISTSYRIVPLEHAVFIGNQAQLLMDNKEAFYAEAYKRYLDWRSQKKKDKDVKERQVAARKAGGWENAVVKGGGLPAFNHQLNECIEYLHMKSLMPALFFVFSRKGCETLAHQVQGSLIDSSETAAIRHIWDFHLHKHKDVLEHLPQAHILKDLVMRGIAFHHSGLLPMLREIVELMFGRGLLKVLFATETFAVGINMPTKTVVFLDLEKYSDETQGLRLLRTDEYIQMAGRAGRRGKDEKGYVFYLPQREPVGLGELQTMMTGKKSAITSQMDFGYDFVLKTFQSKSVRWLELLEKSYWYRQVQGELKEAKLLEESVTQQREALGLTDEQIQICSTRKALEVRAKSATNATKKEAQKQLETLKNKQVGPDWIKLFSTYEIYTMLVGKLTQIQTEIASLQSLLKTKVHPTLQLLQRWGFLNEAQGLTDLGILATEINEGQPILMAKAFDAGVWKDLTPEDFVGFLAAFLQEGKAESDPAPSELRLSHALQEALNFVDELAYTYKKEEEPYQLTFAREGMWEIRTGWIEPLQRWMAGEEAAPLCAQYGLYEGTFLRSVLKVANLVDEWIALATYTKSIELLQTLEGVRATLVRDIVKPESLYLTLD